MLSTVERLLFVFFVLVSLSASYVAFERMVRVIARGQGALRLGDLPAQLWRGARSFLLQGDIIERRRVTSILHYFVAWGFTFYALVNIGDLLEGFIAGFRLFGDGAVGDIYRLLADLFSVAVLIGVAYFLVRRFIAGDRRLTARDDVPLHPKARGGGIARDSLVVGLFILGHVGARFVSQSFLVAAEGGDAWQPFAGIVSGLWAGMSQGGLEAGWHISWWLAIGLILLFVPYFPASKHAHLFMGPINFMTRPQRAALGAMDPLNFEDESIEQFGAHTLTDLSQTQILDAYACIMCNRCQEACPAYATGKELSPAAIEINKRYFLRDNGEALADGASDDTPLLDYALSESALWACTTCGACVEVCPVGNEPMFDILHMRQDRVMMESAFPDQLKAAFTGMERLSNPWGMTEDRLAWTEPLDFAVPTVAQNPAFDVLYWVGCAGAFDPGGQEIARAVATVLHRAGVNFAVLGSDENCTGDSARRAGNEYLFHEMALGNIELLNGLGIDKKTIVTGCPHCFHTLGKEYPAMGGHYRVLHHTQYIAELVGKGRLALNGNVLESVTFHDPCYLGRHNGVYEEPRQALAQASRTLLEMDRHRANSFCCGAGGAQMWKEEEHGREAVNINRYQEAAATGAAVVAVGCPFCAIMMRDASREASGGPEVKDIAEVLVDALA
jgi:Fe-S oxidoreductase